MVKMCTKRAETGAESAKCVGIPLKMCKESAEKPEVYIRFAMTVTEFVQRVNFPYLSVQGLEVIREQTWGELCLKITYSLFSSISQRRTSQHDTHAVHTKGISKEILQ